MFQLTFPSWKISLTLEMASSISSAGGSTWVLLAPSENPPYLNSFTHILFFKLWKKQSVNVLNDATELFQFMWIDNQAIPFPNDLCIGLH